VPKPIRLDVVPRKAAEHLSSFQRLMTLARETVPHLSAEAARAAVRGSGDSIGLEFVETKGVAPIFALFPKAGATPRMTFFCTWHSETLPVTPAASEGAERLALAVTLASLLDLAAVGIEEAGSAAVVVAPGAAHGSLVLDPFLREHRARIASPMGYWFRVLPSAPRRRRIYLGGRGRVVIGLWGGDANPYEIRDKVAAVLHDEAYGPRPLDFELIRKLATSRDALELLEETIEAPEAASSDGESRLKNALFEAHGQVIRPGASHPDRPSAWLSIEIAEGMEAPEILTRVRALAPGSRVEMAEALPWDRVGIHHPSIKALIPITKTRSAGPDIWPSAPWVTPSGVFSRATGMPLVEWGIPLGSGNAVRFPKEDAFGAMEEEALEVMLRAVGALEEGPRVP